VLDGARAGPPRRLWLGADRPPPGPLAGAMAARSAWIGDPCAAKLTAALMGFQPVGAMAIDVTTKPPATVGWE